MKKYQMVLAISCVTMGLVTLGGCNTKEDKDVESVESVTEQEEPEEENSGQSEADTDDELASVEEQAAELENKIQKEALTQTELNTLTEELYKLWDSELNQIWSRLQDTLDEDTMENLTQEERDWISDKEQKVQEAGAQYEGGSMQAMIENEKAAELTKDRVYELIKYLK